MAQLIVQRPPWTRARIAILSGIALVFIAGCIPIGLESEPEPNINRAELSVGTSKTTVRAKLGQPNYELHDGEASYFVYALYGEVDYFAVLLFIYIPFYATTGSESVLNCVLIEFDEQEKLKRFDVKRSPRTYGDCRLLWPNLKFPRVPPQDDELIYLQRMAVRGDPDAQFELSRPQRAKDELEEWEWLCRAADQGHALAQLHVGHHFWYGTSPVQIERTKGFLWYRLAQSNGHEWITDEHLRLLTPDQIAKAKRMLAEWQPGQCEAEVKGEGAMAK